MNWSAVFTFLVANAGNIVAAVMVLWKLLEAAIAAGQNKTSVVREVFRLRH